MTAEQQGGRPEIVGLNLGALYLLQAINSISPLIVIPYLTRVLNPAGYGNLAFFQSLIAYGIVVLDFGFYVSGIRDASRYRYDKSLLGRKFKEVVATKCLLLVCLFAMMLVAMAVVPTVRQNRLLLLACSLQLVGNIALPTWLYQGIEQARKVVAPQLMARLITTVATFLIVRNSSDVVVAATLLSSSDVLCGLLLWRSLRRLIIVKGVSVNWSDIKRTISEDLSLFAISVGSNMYTLFNPMIIEIYYGRIEVAYYAIAFRIASVITKVTGPLIQAVSPKLAVLAIRDKRGAVTLLFRSGAILLLISGGFAAVLLFFPRDLMVLIAGHEYIRGTPVLRAFAPLSALMVIGALVGQNFGVHVGLGRAIARLYWAIGVIDLALMVPMTRAFGAVGSAITVVSAEVLVVSSIVVLVALRGARGS